MLLFSGFLFLLGIYFVLETLCNHGQNVSEAIDKDMHSSTMRDKRTVVKHERAESNETQCTIDITTPEDMDSFMSTANLTKDDEQRLRYYIQFKY